MRDKEAGENKITSYAYDNRGRKNTLIMSGKEKKTYDDYVPMNECGIVLFHSTHERVCAAQEITISMMKDIVDMYKLEI